MPYNHGLISGYIDVYITILKEIIYMQLIFSIYRANTYSCFNLVFT
jgi:hypothetical protein